MPVEKRGNKDTVFRARLTVRQQRYHGPNRSTEQEAADDLRKLEAHAPNNHTYDINTYHLSAFNQAVRSSE